MDELKANLQKYEKSYGQIIEALQDDPNNEQLLKLKKEIGEGIDKMKTILQGSNGDSTISMENEESEKIQI